MQPAITPHSVAFAECSKPLLMQRTNPGGKMTHTVASYFALLEKTSKEGGFPSAIIADNPEGGGRSVQCQYRGPNARKCAAGILIPDDRYRPEMEHHGAGHNDLFRTAMVDLIPQGMLLSDLAQVQFCHDAIASQGLDKPWNHEDFMSRLRMIECFKTMVS
jgi:hypothetical protein